MLSGLLAPTENWSTGGADRQAVIGMVRSTFWVTSTAPDTDFTVKLVDVHPDGRTHNVLDRIVRARCRHGSKTAPDPITPNVAYECTLELGNTALMFKSGHRVRVEISSSRTSRATEHRPRQQRQRNDRHGHAEHPARRRTRVVH